MPFGEVVFYEFSYPSDVGVDNCSRQVLQFIHDDIQTPKYDFLLAFVFLRPCDRGADVVEDADDKPHPYIILAG